MSDRSYLCQYDGHSRKDSDRMRENQHIADIMHGGWGYREILRENL